MLGFRGRKTYKVSRWNTSSTDPELPEERELADVTTANVVSSETTFGDLHKPVLDLDFPHRYEPSSTPGHGHLYLNNSIPWEAYERLLDAMAECRILEPGYVDASKKRKATFVRLPWVIK